MAKPGKWAGLSYQPNDSRFYHYTEGLTPYVAKYYLKLRTRDQASENRGLFDKKYDGEIKGTLYKDFLERPIKKGDFCHVYGKNDRGFFRVVNYKSTKVEKVILEDIEERGGRFTANPKDLLVMTDQLKANLLNEKARAVEVVTNATTDTNPRKIKVRYK